MAKKKKVSSEVDGLVTVLNILREEHDNGNFQHNPFMVFLKIAGESKYQKAIKRVNGLSRDVKNQIMSRDHMSQAMEVVQCCAQTLSVAYDDEELLAAGHVLMRHIGGQRMSDGM